MPNGKYNFDNNKYDKIYNSMFGPNASQNDLNLASEVARKRIKLAHAKQAYSQSHTSSGVTKKSYEDAVDYVRNNKDKFLNPDLNDGKSGAYQIANEIRNDPAKQAEIKAQGYNVSDYINALYAGLSDGNFRSEREYNQHVSDLNKQVKDGTYNSQPDKPKAKPKQKKKGTGLLGNIGGLFKDIGDDVGDKLGGAGNELGNIFKALKDGPGGYKLSDVANDTQNSIKKEQSNDAKRGFSSNLSKEVHRGVNRAMDSASFNNLSAYQNAENSKGYNYNTDYANTRQFGKGGATDFITSGVGYLLPGNAAYKSVAGIGERVAGGLGKLSPKLANIAGKTAEGGAAGGTFGAMQSTADPNMTLKQRLENVGLNTALGGVADPLLHGAVNLLSKLRKPTENAFHEVAPTLNVEPKIKQTSEKPFENISPQKEPKMARVQEPVQTNFATPEEAFNSFRSKIDRTPQKKKDGSLYQKLHTNLVDDLSPLLSLEKKLNGGKVNSAENSLYKTARLFRGSPEKANHIVDNELLPIIKNVEKQGYSYKDLGDYALAMHAKDVNAKGINSGFSNQEIQETINKLQSPALENARQELLKISNTLLDKMQKADLISQEAVDTMRKKWPNYMPLFRSFEDDKVDFHSGLGQALANASSPIKKLEGSNRKAIDPLESMVKNIYQANNSIDRNGIGKQLANLAGKDTEQQFIRKLEPNEDTGRKNVVSVMENGKKVKYEVPPDIYKTMMNLDKESSNVLIHLLRQPASILRAGATLTPEFSLRNPMRDVAQAYIVSKSGFNPVVDFPVGLWQSIFKGKTIKIGNKEFKTSGDLYKQFIRDNGGFGNIVSMDRQMHRKALEKVIKEGNNKKFINIINPKTYINLLRTIADVSESATKLGEYRAALRSGTSRQEAAYRARDIMDFGRSGSSIREANKVVAFLNANIQGKSKLIRAIAENPVKVTSKAAVAVTLPTIGAFVATKYLANDTQKQIIDDAPHWLKNSFWLIPVPGTDQVARIPKPFDLAPIFANIPEKAMEYAYNNDKHAFDGFAKELLSSYSLPVMLTGITPFFEGMANYSLFRQGPIIPQRENDINYPDQYDINTHEASKAIAKGVNKLTGGEGAFRNFGSPRIVDNTISGLTGGLGDYANSFVDWLLTSSGTVDKAEKPSKQVNQQPLLRSFLVNQSSTGESMNKLYDLRDKLTRQKGSAKEHNSLFQNAPEYQLVNSATSKIGKISSQMRTIQNNQSLSGQQKRIELDKLNDLRNKIARSTIKNLNR